jgi:hypothetical protein
MENSRAVTAVRLLKKRAANLSAVILRLVPRICRCLILSTWFDPLDKPEDDEIIRHGFSHQTDRRIFAAV